MKRVTLLFVFILCAAAIVQAQNRWSFKGTVIKMRMTDCVIQRGFRATLAGSTCPQYTVMSANVVYVVVGRHTEEFIPLAEDTDFLIRKNEIVTFSNDETEKSRFVIQEMTRRADWEREEQRKALEARYMERSVNYELRNPSRATTVSSAR